MTFKQRIKSLLTHATGSSEPTDYSLTHQLTPPLSQQQAGTYSGQQSSGQSQGLMMSGSSLTGSVLNQTMIQNQLGANATAISTQAMMQQAQSAIQYQPLTGSNYWSSPNAGIYNWHSSSTSNMNIRVMTEYDELIMRMGKWMAEGQR